MATTRKFSIAATKNDGDSLSITISNPNDSITAALVNTFADKYDELYTEAINVKTAKYVDTSDTFIIPSTLG